MLSSGSVPVQLEPRRLHRGGCAAQRRWSIGLGSISDMLLLAGLAVSAVEADAACQTRTPGAGATPRMRSPCLAKPQEP